MTFKIVLFFAGFAAIMIIARLIVALLAWLAGFGESGWGENHLLLEKTDINGEKVSGYVWSRVVNGKRQYKKMTPEEQKDSYLFSQW